MSRPAARIASDGTPLPRRRTTPQAPAARRERWAADAGVKKAALATAASHHGLAGKRQQWRHRRALRGGGQSDRIPEGSTGSWGSPGARVPTAAPAPASEGAESPSPARALVQARWADVERDGSSDMLPRRKILGISRGFAFSESCNRRCPRAVEAALVDRTLGTRRARSRAALFRLDCVRTPSLPAARRGREPTPDGGARGGGPPSPAPQARADRHHTRGPQLGFRRSGTRATAARALQRLPEERSIERLRGRGREPGESR